VYDPSTARVNAESGIFVECLKIIDIIASKRLRQFSHAV